MRTWEFNLSLTKPLSLNDFENRWKKAKKTAIVRADARVGAKCAQIPPLTYFTAELHYAPRDKRRRDPENLIATLKPLVDGLVDAGVAPDDTPDYYTTTVPVIDPPTGEKTGRLYVIVREMEKP